MTTTQASIKGAMEKVYARGMAEAQFKAALATELGRKLVFAEVKQANEFLKSQQERPSEPPKMPGPVAEPVVKTPREQYFEALGLTGVKMSKENGNFVCGFVETGAAILEVQVTEDNKGMPWVEFKQFLGLAAVNMGLTAVVRLGLENNSIREHIPLEVNPGTVHLYVEKVGDEFEVHAAYKLDAPKPKQEDPQESEAQAKRGIITELMKGNFGTVELLETDAKTTQFINELLLRRADLSGVTDISADALCAKANEYAKYKKQTPQPTAVASVEVPKGPSAQEIAQALLASGFADTVRNGIKVPQPNAPPTAEEVAQALIANTAFVDKVVEGVAAKLTDSKATFVTKVIAGLKTTVTDAAKKEVGEKIGTTVKTLLETGDEFKGEVARAVETAVSELKGMVTEVATDLEVLKRPAVAIAIVEELCSLDESTSTANMAAAIKRLAEAGYGFEGSQKILTQEVLAKIANGEFDGAIEEQFGEGVVAIAKERATKAFPEYEKLIGGESS
jgi:hypothetical protein